MFARLASKGALSKSLSPQSSPLASPKNSRRKMNLETVSPKSQHRSYGDSPQSSTKLNVNDQTGSLFVGAAATVASAAILAGSYYYTHEETVPITGRKRMLDVSTEREQGLAAKTFTNLMQRFHDNILPADHRHSAAVKRVGTRIIKSSGITALQEIDWEFIVIDSSDINAFVLPNGKVCVFTGILDLMEDENGMATVLSHEIAHVAARHSAEHLSLGRFFWNGESVCRFLGFHNMGDWLSNQLERMPFQRFCETEADHIGLILMSKAQYDPTKSVEIWKRLQVFQREKKVESHPTHPSHQERIDNITKWLPEAIHAQRGCSCH